MRFFLILCLPIMVWGQRQIDPIVRYSSLKTLSADFKQHIRLSNGSVTRGGGQRL